MGGGAVAANASGWNYEYVGGGTWEYGTGVLTYSSFKQPTRFHTSTVKVDGVYAYSGTTRPGVTSNASRKLGRTNYAYWNNV
ncbi:lactococcin 972 family bacteriocin [Leifsonia xyli]|uniref:lactococcin 972 family bacteriocin n=1 Tax=Leifsonia xyli TaxID=1575 RepID=UPI003D6666FC